MEEHLSPTFSLFGMVFDLSTIIMTVVCCLLVFLIIWLATRNMTSGTPKGMQNFLEWVIDFVRGIARQTMDNATAEKYVGLGLTLFLYIFIANQIGLITNFVTVHSQPSEAIGITQAMLQAAGGEGVKVGWFDSPTAMVSIPFALAVMVLFYSHWLGMKKGFGSYLKSYVTPHWAMLPLNLIEELAKFLSFPLRLFGNIYAGEVLIWVLLPAIMSGIVGSFMTIPLVLWIGYSIFVGAIQAFIFTILTMVYISHRVQSH